MHIWFKENNFLFRLHCRKKYKTTTVRIQATKLRALQSSLCFFFFNVVKKRFLSDRCKFARLTPLDKAYHLHLSIWSNSRWTAAIHINTQTHRGPRKCHAYFVKCLFFALFNRYKVFPTVFFFKLWAFTADKRKNRTWKKWCCNGSYKE